MPDLLEQTVRYLETLSDVIADAPRSSIERDSSLFLPEFVEALRECAQAVAVAREDLRDLGRPIGPVYSHPGDGDSRELLSARLSALLFSARPSAHVCSGEGS